jgi:hypothetical protein
VAQCYLINVSDDPFDNHTAKMMLCWAPEFLLFLVSFQISCKVFL